MHAQGKIAVFAGLLGLSGVAFGQGVGGFPLDLYVGGAFGNSVVDVDAGNVEFKGFGSIGGKVFGGLTFNKYIGVEGQYVHFGEAEIEGGGASDKLELDGWGAAVTGNLPIINQLSLNGRVGFLNWESDDDDGTDLHVGGGFRFDVVEHFALRADWDYYPMDADGSDLNTHMVSIGGQFNF
ncbi:MAG: porin family protein [Nitrococcus mobilis]|nr:porin family protein [Nitrococcus mobilis]